MSRIIRCVTKPEKPSQAKPSRVIKARDDLEEATRLPDPVCLLRTKTFITAHFGSLRKKQVVAHARLVRRLYVGTYRNDIVIITEK